MENNVLKLGQQSQFLKEKGNEAKVKHDIDVIETINIELEHKVAKLLKENETLKRHYKEMLIHQTTRAKNIEHTTSLIATNDKFKAQIQEKGFAVAALKNELRKLTGNSMGSKQERHSPLAQQRYSLNYRSSLGHQCQKMFEQSSSSLDRQCQMVSAENNTSGPAPFLNVKKTFDQRSSSLVLHQMTSDHNRSELGIQDHSNEQTSSKLVPKVVPLAQDSYITTKVGITIPPSHSNAEDNSQNYVLYDCVMNPLTAQQERKTRKDRGTSRGRHSTSSSSSFDQPSFSHLNDDDDENDEGISRASTPSPTRFVNSLTNEVPRVFQNPPNINPDMEPFYTRQPEIINRQVQL
ncbi:hypothetical protein Tco_0606526 [Tanacetum coccineum]